MVDKAESYLEDDSEGEVEVELEEGKEALSSDEDQEDQKNLEDQEQKEDDNEDQDEKQEFGKRAQKRIKNLVRDRKDLEAVNAELVEEKKALAAQLEEQAGKQTQTQEFAVTQYEETIEAQTKALEGQWYDAYESGDQAKLFEVQRGLARVEANRSKLDDYKQRTERGEEKKPSKLDDQPQPQPQPQPPTAEPRAQMWALENKTWFGKDETMTLDAYSIHRELAEEGVAVGSEDYYNELDTRIREVHPNKFKSKSNQTVASTSRVASKRPKKVRLTAEEKEFAERNNIPLERYAREKVKLAAQEA